MRLIDADELKFKNLAEVNGKLTYVLTAEEIDNAPTIDDLSEYSDKLWQKAYERGKAEARPQGEWIGTDGEYQCNKCYEKRWYRSNYCPQCGRRMEGAENE